jgi:hypothetical protein
MRSSGPRGEVSMFPDTFSARGRLTRRYVSGLGVPAASSLRFFGCRGGCGAPCRVRAVP